MGKERINYFFNSFYNLSDNWYLGMNATFWGLLIKASCNLRGVMLGKKNKFFGYTKLKKANRSLFKIGNNNTFRSFPTSNLIGINRPCILSALTKEANLKIGNNNGFSGTVISCFKEIIIGNNIKFGANTLISDGDWHMDDPRSGIPAKIEIGDNAWLGINVIILKGVKIGENSVIGAGSLVVKDIPANCVAAGNPCVVLKQLQF